MARSDREVEGLRGPCWDPRAGEDHARQVERVGAGESDRPARRLGPADGLERLGRLGEGELLAREPPHEPAARHQAAVAEARRDGTVYTGGERLTDEALARGFYVEPTVVGQLPSEHRLFRDELFVPFTAVHAVDTLDEAVSLSNASVYGLTAGIFSRDEGEVERFLDGVEAGVLYVGTHEAGVLKTIDGGKTWKAANRGLGGLDVHGLAIDPNAPDKVHAVVREKGSGIYRTTTGAEGGWVRVDDGPVGETKALVSVNIPTGMGGIFLYAGTGEGLQRDPDCF